MSRDGTLHKFLYKEQDGQDSYKDLRKEKALVFTAWGESDSDEEVDDKRRTVLVASLDTEVRPSPKNSTYKQIAIEQNEIIIILQGQVDAQENDI